MKLNLNKNAFFSQSTENMHPMNIASTKQMQVMLIACHVIQIVFGIAFRKFLKII
jgi:hypothetical protein